MHINTPIRYYDAFIAQRNDDTVCNQQDKVILG